MRLFVFRALSNKYLFDLDNSFLTSLSKLPNFITPRYMGKFVAYPQGVVRVINGCNLAITQINIMSLKIKIAARLKVKAAGVNLSQKRIDAIVTRAEKGLTDESDDAAIDANLDTINELTPFKEIGALDDHERAKEAKDKADKEAKRLADIAAGKKPDDVELPADTPEWAKAFMKSQKDEAEALKAEIASIKGEKVTSTRREQFIKSMEGTSQEYQAKELKRFDRITFKDDEDFKTFLEDTKDDHAGAVQEEANGGLGGDRPAGSGVSTETKKGEASQAEMDAAFKNFKL